MYKRQLQNEDAATPTIPAPFFSPDIGDFTGNEDTAASGDISLNAIPTLSIADATVDEDGGSVSLTVSISETATSNVAGTYTTERGATRATRAGNNDYTQAVATAFLLPIGEDDVTISIPITDDSVYEGTETFIVNIESADTGVARILDGEATVTINDDETIPVLSVTDATATVAEAAETAMIGVTMSGASKRDVVVNWAVAHTGGNPTEDADFEPAGQPSGSITIMAGDTTGTVLVSLNDDSDDTAGGTDDGETFNLTITSADTAEATVNSSSAVTTVTVIDRVILGSLTLKDTDGNEVTTLAEDSAAGEITVEVALTANLLTEVNTPVTIAFTLNTLTGVNIIDPSDISFGTGAPGDADDNEGATAKTTTLTIPASIDNNISDGTRTLTVTATPSAPGRSGTFDPSFTISKSITITDDEPAALEPPADFSVVELSLIHI
ncbi:MAG: hypothetical protein MPK62_11200, partial [Alphaproteobacteria bacterium]|nr:hypothetical protein [Alphaproteobacteria bacterium]